MPPQNDPPQGYVWARTLVPSVQPKEKERLHKYDDKSSSAYKEFKYTRLTNMKQRIRLLKLGPGRSDSDAEIACELFEAEFQDGQGGILIGDNKEKYTYEALTWCWGTNPSDCLVVIEQQDSTRKKMAISEELAWALLYLREPAKSRILWIDAICIDQSSTDEKNHQVQMMAKIYSHAERVVVWLGMDDPDSRRAIKFVKDEILHLQRFDELCDDERNSQKWQALLLLMQRPWFFRRWVVQEISLAKSAMIHCGPDQIPWNDFCVAVELFVEVETVTHRLSEVMKKDPKFFHLPGWFDYVSALGASLLVEATTMIFRQYQPDIFQKRLAEGQMRNETFRYNPGRTFGPSSAVSPAPATSPAPAIHPDGADSMADLEEDYTPRNGLASRGKLPSSVPRGSDSRTETQLSKSIMSTRSPLLSLEYLVSKLSIFETTEPRDAIYAFLAIAKDTLPEALSRTNEKASEMTSEERKQTLLAMFGRRQQKLFNVDYDKAYAEVCQDFMEFCIRASALSGSRSHALDILCRPWAPNPSQGISGKKVRKVRLHPVISENYATVLKSMEREVDVGSSVKTKNSLEIPLEMRGLCTGALKGFMKKYERLLEEWADVAEDTALPSWIPRLEGASFIMSSAPGTKVNKMSRQNANPLVGLPGNQHTYDAGQGMPVNLDELRFNRLYLQGAHCMHVKGFQLSSVLHISPTSQGGQIPKQWLKLANWENAGNAQTDEGPPEEFWRMLVADRGINARNPPSFYARACRESAAKGGLAGGTINTSDLIYNEQNSIVVQFCRRVQEVIWNKKLIVTADGRLGLASEQVDEGDLICILYGASVPVILRPQWKAPREIAQEEDEAPLFHKLDIMKRLVQKAISRRRQKKAWAKLPEVGIPKKGTKPARWGKREVRAFLTKWRKDQGLPEKSLREKSEISSKENLRNDLKGKEAPITDAAPRTSNKDANRKKTGESSERTCSDHYFIFMGECYIHGMMDGEAMKWKSETTEGREVEDKVFELR